MAAVIDLAESRLVREIDIGPVPNTASSSGDGATADVTLQQGGAVAAIDMDRLEKNHETRS